MTIKSAIALSALAAMGLASNAYAGNVTAASYTLSLPGDGNAQGGTYNYFDETRRQLIDGKYGNNIWQSDLGNGPAYEWVGWANRGSVNVDFNMGGSKHVDSISVGTVQDFLGDVVVPNVSIYSSFDNLHWAFAGQLLTSASSANNFQHFELTLNGLNITAPFIRVNLSEAYPAWIFTDEVDFNTGHVPDGGATVGLLGGAVVLLAGMRKRFAF